MNEGPLKLYMAGMFALAAHEAVKQKRKYTGDPYFVHPMAVERIVSEVPGVTYTMRIAAMLHDVVEDTGVTDEVIEAVFGGSVAAMVEDLTDFYTKERFPGFNRAERKQLEAERYALVSNDAKTIKLADGIDNTRSIIEHDQKFLKTYGPEKRRLLESLRGGDEHLWNTLDGILAGAGY